MSTSPLKLESHLGLSVIAASLVVAKKPAESQGQICFQKLPPKGSRLKQEDFEEETSKLTAVLKPLFGRDEKSSLCQSCPWRRRQAVQNWFGCIFLGISKMGVEEIFV